MSELVINVVGTPAPQGSKRAFVVNGRAVMAESSKKVKPWRQDVVAAINDVLDSDYVRLSGPGGGLGWGPDIRSRLPLAGPVRVDITYYLLRPRYHYRSGKHADQLKPGAPIYADKKPDKDKLDRATHDALTSSGLIRDDAQIVAGYTEKLYADAATGARITVRPLTVSPADAGTPARTAGETHPQEVLPL